MITLFVGAGYTGARVLRRLPDAVALGRSRPGDERLDLDRDERLRIALPAQYAVIYSVPPASDQPGDPRLAKFLALLPHPPARIVYLSTTGVYGNCDGERVDETTGPRPESARAERRLAAERLLAEWCTGRNTTAVVLSGAAALVLLFALALFIQGGYQAARANVYEDKVLNAPGSEEARVVVAEQQAILDEKVRWKDEENGIAVMPIEDAMERLVEQVGSQ